MKINEKQMKILIPLIAVLGGFIVGALIMLVSGINPLKAFSAFIQAITGINLMGAGSFFNIRYVGEFIVSSTPLILTGLAVAFAFRTGLFNIGAEGQFIVGAYAAIAVGILIQVPKLVHLPLVILAAALAGALWAFIPGYLKARFNVHEVVTTIMLNYTALHLTNYLLKTLPGSTVSETKPVYGSANLHSEFLSNLTGGSRLHWGILIAIASVFIFWFIINKTIFGYELRSVGFNRHASQYAGMKVNQKIVFSMMISGAFAGLAGAVVAVGTFDFGRVIGSFENYGFDGIAVALVGGNTAIGVLISGFLFGALKNAQPLMQSNGVPKDIAIIIQAMIVLFVAMQFGIKQFIVKYNDKKNKSIDEVAVKEAE